MKTRIGWTWGRFLPVLAVLTFGCNVTSNGSNDSDGGGSNSQGDGDGTAGESGGTGDEAGESGGGPVTETTIYEIQQGNVAPDTLVRISNVVVTTPVEVEDSQVFVQEQEGGEFSGIPLYLYTEIVDGVDLAPGDIVTVVGKYTEFYDSSQLTVTNIQDLEIVDQTDVPAPVVVDARDIATGGELAENYEGVLVRVENVTVAEPDLGHGDFSLEGGLIVDGFFLGAELPHPPAGTVIESITGPLIYSFENYKLAPRTADDLPGIEIGEQAATVYDIQTGKVAENSLVLVENVIVTTGPTADDKLFFVQEADGGASSGIAVFVPDGAAALGVEPGNVVTVRGTYVEFYDLSEIRVTEVDGVQITGSAEVPAPALVAAADVATGGAQQEEYEGVLVQVEDVTVTEATDEYGDFVADGLRIDNLFFPEGGSFPEPALDQVYTSIVGVMTYSHEEARLAPRSLDDIVEGAAP